MSGEEDLDEAPIPVLAEEDEKARKKMGLDEVTPDGLAYHVNTMELEVEKFLEVDSWNSQFGFDESDSIEEKIVDEMKAVQEAGDLRRSKMKSEFNEEDKTLTSIDGELQKINAQLEEAAKEAENASKSDMEEVNRSTSQRSKASEESNPYTEYKNSISNLPEVNDSSVRSRMAQLKAETDLLRRCMQNGSFSDYKNSVAGRSQLPSQ